MSESSFSLQEYLASDEFKREHASYLRRNPRAVQAREAHLTPHVEPKAPARPDVVIDDALALVLRMLAPSNPNITESHKGLLRATLETLIRNAFGELDARVIVGAPTGAGKSSCIAAALFTLHKYGLLEDYPVLILAEQI